MAPIKVRDASLAIPCQMVLQAIHENGLVGVKEFTRLRQWHEAGLIDLPGSHSGLSVVRGNPREAMHALATLLVLDGLKVCETPDDSHSRFLPRLAPGSRFEFLALVWDALRDAPAVSSGWARGADDEYLPTCCVLSVEKCPRGLFGFRFCHHLIISASYRSHHSRVTVLRVSQLGS